MANQDDLNEQTEQQKSEEPDITIANPNGGEGGPGEDPDYDEAGEGDDEVDDRH